MGLPNVNITRSNNNLGRTVNTTDNVFAMLLSGAAVASKIALGEAKLFTSIDDLTTYGITSSNNALAFAEITAFYSLAAAGTKLWVMLYANTSLLATVCDKDSGAIRTLVDSTSGELDGVFVNKVLPGGYTISLTEGLDDDVWNAVTKLQALCEDFGSRNLPFFAVVPGFGFLKANAGTMRDLNTMTKNQVAINLGSDVVGGKPAIGALAGWLADNEYYHNAGRVASGSVLDAAYFMDGTAADSKDIVNNLGTLHDRRYIFFRKFNGKSGFYFNDDPTACSVTDDFSSISWNRVANKAQKLAYSVLVEKLNGDVDTDPISGGIARSLVSDWEGDVEAAINNAMTKKGAISAVKCIIDPDQVNLTTDSMDATIQIVRKGQAKTINVAIGYVPTIG
ncbi:MAG TPA: DUF2586 family protein [Panacibacter sp.]|nr:DUF2586 family protein [Panacibacter sp.]HNP46966.1 DUF2586 family protein [Panacibacter sp.]